MDQHVSGLIPAARLEGFRVAAPYGEGKRARKLLKDILDDAG